MNILGFSGRFSSGKKEVGCRWIDPPPPHRTDLVARHTILVLTFSFYLLRTQLLVFVIGLEATESRGDEGLGLSEAALCPTPQAISWISLAHYLGLLPSFNGPRLGVMNRLTRRLPTRLWRRDAQRGANSISQVTRNQSCMMGPCLSQIRSLTHYISLPSPSLPPHRPSLSAIFSFINVPCPVNHPG